MSAEPEEWRAVVGFEGRYEVSSLGRVRSLSRVERLKCACGHGFVSRLKRGQLLKLSVRTDGYLKVGLHGEEGHQRQASVHRTVCTAFHGPPAPGMDAAHGDGVKTNNRADNLRWATRAQNMADKVRHGTQLRGEQHAMAKLRADQVREIRTALADGVGQHELGRRYDVSASSINLIANGTNWAWLE
jgi:hypothetical protein